MFDLISDMPQIWFYSIVNDMVQLKTKKFWIYLDSVLEASQSCLKYLIASQLYPGAFKGYLIPELYHK